VVEKIVLKRVKHACRYYARQEGNFGRGEGKGKSEKSFAAKKVSFFTNGLVEMKERKSRRRRKRRG